MNEMAESYVKLVLAVGQHDEGYVDAYYGPQGWRDEVEAFGKGLDAVGQEAAELHETLLAVDVGAAGEMVTLRYQFLQRQLEALMAYVNILGGVEMSFDEESKALYDAIAPTHPESYFQDTLDALDRLLPGKGPLAERLEVFRAQFVIPTDRLDTVFKVAIEECRKRTRRYIDLPDGERFVVEYVTDKPWSGYNWYQGDSYSLIQVNTDLPIYISRAIDLACHEGYPGHHVYNTLLEHHLVRQKGWMEYCVYPLFSPMSLVAEGSANFGIEVAFPGEERITFEREVLFPMAGIDPAKAEGYYEVQYLVDQLSYAGNEAARRYLNGEKTREETIEWLARYALSSRERSTQRVSFYDTYRSYVINYNLGQDLVRDYVEKKGGTTDAREKRWREFSSLLSSPRLPSGLR
jgi:hypothetical protein